MKRTERPSSETSLILRGINLDLTDAMKDTFAEKAERLFRHEPRIIRLRLDIEDDSRGGAPQFAAKGYIEIGGPDIVASVSSDDPYKSVDELIDVLDRKLRKRSTARTSRRHTEELTDHEPA